MVATSPLRRAFAETGFTIAELAEASNVSTPSMGEILRGNQFPLLRTQYRIAKALSLKLGRPIDIDDLWPTRADAEASL